MTNCTNDRGARNKALSQGRCCGDPADCSHAIDRVPPCAACPSRHDHDGECCIDATGAGHEAERQVESPGSGVIVVVGCLDGTDPTDIVIQVGGNMLQKTAQEIDEAWARGAGRCDCCYGVSDADFDSICDCSRWWVERGFPQPTIQVIGSSNPPVPVGPTPAPSIEGSFPFRCDDSPPETDIQVEGEI